MSDLIDMPLGLPPGLWLPTAEEDTDRFRAENFNHNNHEPEDLVEFGMFMTALAMYDEDRVSKMPTYKDVEDLLSSGYGMSTYRLSRQYGGVVNIQDKLGFFSIITELDEQKVADRYAWIARYAMPKDPSANPEDMTAFEIIQWCSSRDLAPSLRSMVDLFESPASVIRSAFGGGVIDVKSGISARQLYKIGKQVIVDNNGPISSANVTSQYDEKAGFNIDNARRVKIGSPNELWANLGFGYGVSEPLTQDKVADGAIRLVLNEGDIRFAPKIAAELSSDKRFVSRGVINRLFKGFPAFREYLEPRLELAKLLRDDFKSSGVSEHVFALFNRRFDNSDEHINWLHTNMPLMRVLSEEGERQDTLLKLLETGLDVDCDEIYKIQAEIMIDYLKSLGFKSYEAIQPFLDQVPAIDTEEAIVDAGFYLGKTKTDGSTPVLKKNRGPSLSKSISSEQLEEARRILIGA